MITEELDKAAVECMGLEYKTLEELSTLTGREYRPLHIIWSDKGGWWNGEEVVVWGSKFQPSINPAHMWICIQWAEKNGKELTIIWDEEDRYRIINFGLMAGIIVQDDITPRHVVECFVKAFDTKCKERCEGTHGSQGPPGQCVNQCSGKHIGDEHFCDQECNIPKEGEEWK
jgi:hypothetical protein